MVNCIAVDDDAAVQLSEMFRLMGDASRLRIIAACLSGPVCVSNLAERTGLSASLVSHHLRLLRAARILRSERQGKNVFYSAADHHIRRVIEDMTAHIREPDVDR
ncbi:MAG: ArsR family transcriptional regulator, lead/cadmium/zinc/bismuth-responsive transcriptional [Rhodospirillaceae bacterium]|nr:ArsR family transcriptional regulator, lead/cadmium/zinc/bismuth-responsive transcriptional [Rhodospirillaceae bacterium]